MSKFNDLLEFFHPELKVLLETRMYNDLDIRYRDAVKIIGVHKNPNKIRFKYSNDVDFGNNKVIDFVVKRGFPEDEVKKIFFDKKIEYSSREKSDSPIIAIDDLEVFNANIEQDRVYKKISKILLSKEINCFSLSYHAFVAARHFGVAIPAVNTNVISFIKNKDEESFFLQVRSQMNLDYSGYYNSFGGLFLADSHYCNFFKKFKSKDSSIYENGFREFSEETYEFYERLGLDFQDFERPVLITLDPFNFREDGSFYRMNTPQFNIIGVEINKDGVLDFLKDNVCSNRNSNIEGVFTIKSLDSIKEPMVARKFVPTALVCLYFLRDLLARRKLT